MRAFMSLLLVAFVMSGCQRDRVNESAGSAPANTPAANEAAKQPSDADQAAAYASGWVSFDGTPAVGHVRKGASLPKEDDIGDVVMPSVDELVDAAMVSLERGSNRQPELADLRLVLRTTLRCMIDADFDSYDSFLRERGCKNNSTLARSADDLHRFTALGYRDAKAWNALSDQEKCRAYWVAIDERRAKWRYVDLGQVKAGSGYSATEDSHEHGMFSLAVYSAPGGAEFSNSCQADEVPVVHVFMPVRFSQCTQSMTLYVGFDAQRKRWYACGLLQRYSHAGPSFIRI